MVWFAVLAATKLPRFDFCSARAGQTPAANDFAITVPDRLANDEKVRPWAGRCYHRRDNEEDAQLLGWQARHLAKGDTINADTFHVKEVTALGADPWCWDARRQSDDTAIGVDVEGVRSGIDNSHG